MASTLLPSQELNFKQWQVWAVLLLASACAYFSLSVHYLTREQTKVAAVVGELDGLVVGEAPADPRKWLVDVHRLVPVVRPFAQGATAQLATTLDDLVESAVNDRIDVADVVFARQQLRWLGADVRTTLARHTTRLAQLTHFYYWSVIGFVLAIVSLVLRRRRKPPVSPVAHLLSDEVLFPNAPIAMTLSDERDRLIRVNPAFEQLCGFTEAELCGQSAQSDDTGRHDLSYIDDMKAALVTRGRWSGNYWLRHKDGRAFSEKVMRVALGNDHAHPEGFLTLSMDPVISDDEKRLMLWQAHHDNLTKLPNANLLHERLARALLAQHQDAQHDGHDDHKRGAVISIDLDNFQIVNDSVGYANGDQVLIDAGYRISLCARESDTVARMGSDLFVIVLNEIDDLAEPERIARSAVDQLAKPFNIDHKEFFVSASVGIAVFPHDGTEKGELLQKADAARMTAKARGGNRVAFFEDQMNDAAARRMELEIQLRKAIGRNELELHYQPIMDVARGEVYGAEALLRWQHPELGMVSPGEFIPVAEDSGLIVDVGQWVIAEVQRQLGVWQGSGLSGLRVSLNVSARQIAHEASAQAVLDALARGHTNQLTVELTESALVEDLPGPKKFLQGLKELGIQVALDDFGTGYSSVAYLRNFEFDVLKIDKCFIDELDEVRDYGLVASIVSMGRILGMRVVAEGVEEEKQLARLQQIGCDYVQGYLYSKPLAVVDFEAFVSQHSMQSVG